MQSRLSVLLLAGALAVAPAAQADDVTDQIAEALEAYKAGKYAQAASDLEFAVQAIRRKQAEGLQAVFPNAPKGWQADEVQVGTEAMGMMGGISARREYRKQVPEDAEVSPTMEITIVGESPMLQAALMMMTNPAMVGSGAKPVKLGSQRGFLRQNPGSSPEITAVVANRLLVTVRGDSATEADLTALAKSIDFPKLEKVAQP